MNSERAIETLLEVDPQFQALAQVLYGPEVDAQELWDDVFGVAKADGVPDQHKALKRIGLAATLIGAGLGVKELGEGVAATDTVAGGAVHSLIGSAKTATPKAVKTVLKKPGFKIGAAGAMLGGDLVATHGLSASDQPKQSVSKLDFKPFAGGIKTLASGIHEGWKGIPKEAAMLGPQRAPSAAGAKQEANAAGVGSALRHPLKAASKKPAIAVGGSLATGAVAQQAGQDYYYGKSAPEFHAEGTFTKFDTDKQLAFGWASVVKKDGQDVVDRQGDYMTIEDVEDAAYRYVMTSRIGGDMHKRNGERPHHVSDMVESFVITPEKIAKLGLPENTPQGWWVGFKIHDEQVWQDVKIGKKVGFSVHGKGKRADHVLDGY
jgi:hypothetical protein